jgi:hypothetical protein
VTNKINQLVFGGASPSKFRTSKVMSTKDQNDVNEVGSNTKLLAEQATEFKLA